MEYPAFCNHCIMRNIIYILFLIIVQGATAQESYRNFNEVNPALESLYKENFVFRNIQTKDALFNYFHIHSNLISRKIITSLDVQTRSFEIYQEDQLKVTLKVNYQFRITRKLSLFGGLGIGSTYSESNTNGFVIPAIALVTRKFTFGFNSQIHSESLNYVTQNSSQVSYSLKIPYGKNTDQTHSVKGKKPVSKSFDLSLSYLNYWQKEKYLKQYLVSKVEVNYFSMLLGIYSLDLQNLHPVIGLGMTTDKVSVNFQTVLNTSDITEMQVSLKFRISRLIKRHRTFSNISMPNF